MGTVFSLTNSSVLGFLTPPFPLSVSLSISLSPSLPLSINQLLKSAKHMSVPFKVTRISRPSAKTCLVLSDHKLYHDNLKLFISPDSLLFLLFHILKTAEFHLKYSCPLQRCLDLPLPTNLLSQPPRQPNRMAPISLRVNSSMRTKTFTAYSSILILHLSAVNVCPM